MGKLSKHGRKKAEISVIEQNVCNNQKVILQCSYLVEILQEMNGEQSTNIQWILHSIPDEMV